MILGAGSQLFSSILLYNILTPTDYGLYSLLLTYIATIFSFGLLGLEQTFLRLCVVRKGDVYINKYLGMLLFCGLFVGPLSLTVLAKLFFIKDMSIITLYCLSLMSAYLMFVYNFKRISGDFVASQFVSNIWKIGVLFSLFLFPFIKITFTYLTMVILVMFCLCSMYFLYQMYITPVRILRAKSEQMNEIVGLSFSFLFSMGVLTVLSFFDRYLISIKFDVVLFGDYFFLVNVFVYPFVLFANYYGFRKLVEFKESFDFSLFKQELITLFVKVLFFGVCYICIVLFLSQTSYLAYDFYAFSGLIVPLVVFGGIKILYSSISAAMGARGHGRYIFQSNLITLFLVVVFGVTIFFIDVDIVFIAWIMVFLWLCRSILYFYSVVKFVVKIEVESHP